MILTIINNKSHSFAQFEEVANVFGQGDGIGTYFDLVTWLQILLSRVREELLRLQLCDCIFSWTICYAKLEVACLFIDLYYFLTPFTVIIILKLMYGKSVIELVSQYKTWILHEVFSHALLLLLKLIFLALVGKVGDEVEPGIKIMIIILL